MMRFIIALILSFVSIASFAQTQQTLGAPGTRIATKGDMSVDSIFYLPRTLVTSRAPFQSGALRYQASDSALYHWTGTAWRRVSPLIDTGTISTRAWRQKGIDSIVTLISTLGGGTVLSVSAGTGMNFTTITTSGSVSADTSVLSTRAWRRKGDDSLGAVIAAKVNISDTSTMLAAYLRKADTTSMLSPYLRKTDTTAMLTPYVRIAGFGLTKGTQALSVDSALIATRARVQKGIDSVASLVTTTDSLLFSTRAWRQKGVDSVAALANTKATATGTTNYLSKFTGTSSLGNSIVYATTSEVGISTPSPTHPLDVNGRVRVRTIDSTATGMNMLYADVDGVIKKAAVPAGGSGTVTSVAAGTGMSFTTITTTGSVSADTVALATRAWRQKGDDSVAAIANAKVGGTGTINYIPKFTGTSSIGNSILFDNGNVGINTTNPDFALSVNGTVSIGGVGANLGLQAIPVISTALPSSSVKSIIGSLNSGYGFTAGTLYMQPRTGVSAPMVFGTEGAERMRLTAAGRLLVGTTSETGASTVDIAGTLRSTQGANFATSSGSVGIGTTSPSSILEVREANRANSSNVTNIGIYTTNSQGADLGGTLGLGGVFSGTSVAPFASIRGGKVNSTDDNYAGYLAFQTIPNGGVLTERMRIDNVGQVGIGTTSPDENLTVVGDGDGRIRIGSGVGGNTANIGLTGAISSTNYTLSGDAGNNNLAINRPTGGAMSFRSNGSAQMTLTSAGRLLVGTETEGTNTVDINGTLRTVNGANFATTSGGVLVGAAGSTTAGIPFEVYKASSQVNAAVRADAGQTAVLNIIGDGATIGSTSFDIIQEASNKNAYVFNRAAAPLYFGTSNDFKMTIAADGKVGIGLTTPAELLDVNGKARIRTIDSTSSPINMLTSDVNGVIRKTAVPSASLSGGISGYMTRWSGSSTVDTSQIFQQANRIGIGTATPVGRLTVVGDGDGRIHAGGVLGGNTAAIGFNATFTSANYNLAGSTNGDLVLNSASGQPIEFRRNNSNVMTLNSDGTLLINTASADNNVKLRVNGRARVETIDSSAGPINMLWADVNGNIRKAAVPAGGGSGVTSVATGFGIDGGTITSTGTLTADTVEMATRSRVQKGIDSVGALARVTGSGTTNYVPLWTGSTALGNSSIYEASSEVLIGTTSDAGAFKLQVSGVTYSSDGLRTGNPNGGTAATWKLGSRVASSVALDGTQYIEVDIGGTLYYLATVSFLAPKP